MIATPSPELVNLTQLARRTGLTQPWLKSEALAGRLPCLIAGTRLLFNLPAVETVLAERASQQAVNCG